MTARTKPTLRRKATPDESARPLTSAESERLQRLEYLLDVMVGAMSRISARTMDAGSDIGQRVMVRGDLARGTLLTVRGIAEEAIAIACEDAER